MVAEKFQIHGVKITGKCICELKNRICSIYLCPQAKISPSFLSLPLQAGGNYSFPPHNFFFSAEREEDYGAKKITKIKLARVLVTSCDKFHHFSMKVL